MALNFSFQHIIATRFYLPYKTKLPGYDWFDNRLDLLRRYTAPAVHQQICQDFTWILLVVADTDPQRVLWLESASKAKVLLVEDLTPGYAARAVSQEIKRTVTAEWVLTTRLDSDDLLHRDFVQDLHRLLLPEDQVVWFQNGLASDMKKVLSGSWPANQFSSLLERNDDSVGSVYQLPHKKLARELKSRKLPVDEPRFLVHVNNLRIGAKPNEWSGKKATPQQLHLIKRGFPAEVSRWL